MPQPKQQLSTPVLGITNHAAYPVFRPTQKVSGKTPTLLQEIPEERLKEQYNLKQKYRATKNLPDFVHHTIKGGMIVRSFGERPENK